MRGLLPALLVAMGCTPQYVCEAPCHGESATEQREGGIVCYCVGNGRYSVSEPPAGARVLLEQPGFLAAEFEWTSDEDKCAGYRDWWDARAPQPCAQPGGGNKQSNP